MIQNWHLRLTDTDGCRDLCWTTRAGANILSHSFKIHRDHVDMGRAKPSELGSATHIFTVVIEPDEEEGG